MKRLQGPQSGHGPVKAFIAQNPKSRLVKTVYAWLTLSDVYAKMGNKPEAVKAAEKAVEFADTQSKPAMQKKLDALRGPAPERK